MNYDKDPIYLFGEAQKIFFHDIVSAIKSAGVQAGDTAIIHVDLGAFGKIGTLMSREDFAYVFIDAFLKVLGDEGTVLCPTFTYSFCKGEKYNPQETPSTVGLFSEEFRKHLKAYNSDNPIFSVAGIGRNAKRLLSNLSNNCFGEGSIYDKLNSVPQAKYVVVGVNHFICTQVHHVERMQEVPYRYVKEFSGTIRKGDESFEDKFEFFVRYLDADVETTFDKIEKHLLNKGLMTKVNLGNSHISCTVVSDITREGKAALAKDPLIFLSKEPDYASIDRQKVQLNN